MNKNKIFVEKRAIVENVDHPQGLAKCQVRVQGLWDGVPLEALPWAEYHLPVGSRFNDGDFSPSQVGDVVWVRFDEGDTRFPIITGSCYFAPDKKPNLPHEVFGGESAHQHKRAADQPTPSAPSMKDRISAQHNFLTEITHEGAYRVTHKASGTAWEITKDGEIVFHCEKERHDSVLGDMFGKIIGLFKQEVGKDLKFIVKGDAEFDVSGEFKVNKASAVKLLDGLGVITGQSACHFTGSPHADMSTKVFAAK